MLFSLHSYVESRPIIIIIIIAIEHDCKRGTRSGERERRDDWGEYNLSTFYIYVWK
jgi:hypothetical protein